MNDNEFSFNYLLIAITKHNVLNGASLRSGTDWTKSTTTTLSDLLKVAYYVIKHVFYYYNYKCSRSYRVDKDNRLVFVAIALQVTTPNGLLSDNLLSPTVFRFPREKKFTLKIFIDIDVRVDLILSVSLGVKIVFSKHWTLPPLPPTTRTHTHSLLIEFNSNK